MSNLELHGKVEKLEITAEKISALLVEVLNAYYNEEGSVMPKTYAHWKLLIDMAFDYILELQRRLIAIDEGVEAE